MKTDLPDNDLSLLTQLYHSLRDLYYFAASLRTRQRDYVASIGKSFSVLSLV